MLPITPHHRICLAVKPVDFRCGIDGLAAICRGQLQSDPFCGYLFAFRNKKGSSVKLLIYDGNGFWLCQKRFSQGTLKSWPQPAELITQIKAVELLVMLQQGDPKQVKLPEDWRRLL